MKILGPLLLTILFLITACTKEANTGLATIEGYIQTDLYSKSTGLYLTSYMSQDERIYIVYGDNSFYDDDTRTSFNGKYEFPYLTKGDYTLFAYSECLFNLVTCPSESEEIITQVTISERKEDFTNDTIIIKKYD